ncbi:PAS domain-containing sensor histidine kinase [Streptomyces tauricus]|uniref:PAS domain-containing sensor histidine kinase n=1 Tax=Streptomyces tauricus TaxID=68274 RepID=UPI0033E3B4C1
MADDGRQELYAAMTLAAPDGIVAVDADGRVGACNPAAAALLERPADELIGSVFGFPLDDGESTEVTLVLPSGRNKVVEMTVALVRFHGRRLYVATLRDGTRRQQADQVLQAALEHQSVVVAVAAHQLHNPLAALAALVHVLREPPPGLADERRAEVVERIAERTARLQALVRKLLTAARIDGAAQQGTPEPVRVRDFLLAQFTGGGSGSGAEPEPETGAEPGAGAGSGPRPKPEPRPEPGAEVGAGSGAWLGNRALGDGLMIAVPGHLVARVDPVGFAEIFGNYLENALAYGRDPVEITAREAGGRIEVRVADHGSGVPESFVPHLFERYRRDPATAAATEGTGLGLWIARNLARANGGDAWYEPGRPNGAVFCVSLPKG